MIFFVRFFKNVNSKTESIGYISSYIKSNCPILLTVCPKKNYTYFLAVMRSSRGDFVTQFVCPLVPFCFLVSLESLCLKSFNGVLSFKEVS